jgi:hypothetical protein
LDDFRELVSAMHEVAFEERRDEAQVGICFWIALLSSRCRRQEKWDPASSVSDQNHYRDYHSTILP